MAGKRLLKFKPKTVIGPGSTHPQDRKYKWVDDAVTEKGAEALEDKTLAKRTVDSTRTIHLPEQWWVYAKRARPITPKRRKLSR